VLSRGDLAAAAELLVRQTLTAGRPERPRRFSLDGSQMPGLALMASERPLPGKLSGSVFHGGWSTGAIAARASGFGDSLPALIWTLEAHGLIRAEASSAPWQTSRAAYNVTQAASQLLECLAEG
jgi:hypothetical protein